MGYESNREPRRQWRTHKNRSRVPCTSCGAIARLHSAELPFCNTCLDWARKKNLGEWDELGVGD